MEKVDGGYVKIISDLILSRVYAVSHILYNICDKYIWKVDDEDNDWSNDRLQVRCRLWGICAERVCKRIICVRRRFGVEKTSK